MYCFLINLNILPGLISKEGSKAEEFLQTVFALCSSNLRCKNNTLIPTTLRIWAAKPKKRGPCRALRTLPPKFLPSYLGEGCPPQPQPRREEKRGCKSTTPLALPSQTDQLKQQPSTGGENGPGWSLFTKKALSVKWLLAALKIL